MSSKNGSLNSASASEVYAYFGHIVSPISYEDYSDYPEGVLYVDERGLILAAGDRRQLESKYKPKAAIDFGKRLIMPGLIDLHVHLVQFAETGMTGETLLGWLNKYTFPEEAKFANNDYARRIATWFLSELLANGTTTAAVFMTTHAEATEVAFKTAATMGNRLITGKMMMDRNTLPELTVETSLSLQQSEELCKRWHGYDDGRLLYAFTPRFAPTSTFKELAGAGSLWRENKGTYVQTHVSENADELKWVQELFPQSKNYLDVYDRAGMLGKNSLFAHAIHHCDSEIHRLSETASAVVHCPSSNFFIKSGVFPYRRMRSAGVKIGLGSDVAGGPELSIFKSMKDADYMQSHWITARELFYMATLGGAIAANLDHKVGKLAEGKEADFIVVDPTVKSAVAPDMLSRTTDEILSNLVYLGDDRSVVATYIRGKELYFSPGLDKQLLASEQQVHN